jgi:3-hydroxyisobutyrate dehydrogenase-like beta-hydroxyacid dehydrogenase/ABC-type transporter lipoprotein component MlaA
MKVGVIGLGGMGAGMAESLLRAGHDVSVWNRTAKRSEPLAGKGAAVARTPSDLFAGEAVVTMLSTDEAVRAVVVEGGVLAKAAPGLVHVMSATISPAFSDELARMHREHGVHYVAAPVLGRPDVAAQGELNVLVAGEDDALAKAQPVLDAIGGRTWRMGDKAHQANVAKLAVNFMIAAAMETMAEAFALVEKEGLEPKALHELIGSTLFAAPVYKNYGAMIVERRFEPAAFKLPLGLKDMRLALAAGEAARTPLPLSCGTTSSTPWPTGARRKTGRRSRRSPAAGRGCRTEARRTRRLLQAAPWRTKHAATHSDQAQPWGLAVLWRARVLRASLLITALSLATGTAAFAQTGLNTTSRTEPARSVGPAVANPTAPGPAGGAATGPNPDPYEGLNRKSYALFRYLDRHIIRPGAVFYSHAVPKVARTGLHNAIQNVGEPVIFFNDVLQLHPKAAGQTLGRFAMNSTFGVAGLGDPATRAGLPYHANGFGTTLGRYGVPPGPFLFIPVIGPSDVRDAFGSGVDALSDPLTWINYTGRWGVNASRTVIGGLDTRANADPQLKQLDTMATDPYASLRSLYLQNRQAEVTGGQVNVNDLPDFGPETGAPNEAGTAGAPQPNVGPPGAAAALPERTAPTTAQPAAPMDSEPSPPPPPR